MSIAVSVKYLPLALNKISLRARSHSSAIEKVMSVYLLLFFSAGEEYMNSVSETNEELGTITRLNAAERSGYQRK